MKTFKLHTNGKEYNVAVRGAYRDSITSEKKLRASLMSAAKSHKTASETLVKKLEADKVHEVAEFFGILMYSCPTTR